MILTVPVAFTQGSPMLHSHAATYTHFFFFHLHWNSVLLHTSLGFHRFLEYLLSMYCTAEKFVCTMSSMNVKNSKVVTLMSITPLCLTAVIGSQGVQKDYLIECWCPVCLNWPFLNIWKLSFHAFWTWKIFSFRLMLCQYPALFDPQRQTCEHLMISHRSVH